MLKFEHKFDSLAYDDTNQQRVKDVLANVHAEYSLHRDGSGCVLAVVYLPSFMEFLTLEMKFKSAGLRD